jgi:hypothetical protein
MNGWLKTIRSEKLELRLFRQQRINLAVDYAVSGPKLALFGHDPPAEHPQAFDRGRFGDRLHSADGLNAGKLSHDEALERQDKKSVSKDSGLRLRFGWLDGWLDDQSGQRRLAGAQSRVQKC